MEFVPPYETPKELPPQKPFRIQYTIKEAAYMLCTHENTLMKWLEEFDVPSYKIGGKGKNFVLHKDLEVLIRRSAMDDTDHIWKNEEKVYGKVKENWEEYID